jgi:two-component system sensor histidine kinase KdpD
MEDRDTEGLFYLGLGPLGAILLGAGLVPIRGLTTASNFAFLFIALTITVAGLGGRWPGVSTAIMSALSLDFFLTEPYGKLVIRDKHDVLAAVGLCLCGLIAAALGTDRGRKIASLGRSRKHLELFHSVLGELDPAAPVEPQLTNVLRASREGLPIAAAVVRDTGGQVVASSMPSDALRPVPDGTLGSQAFFPREGARIALMAGTRPLGWLDVWGTGLAATADARRTLADVSRVVALLLSRTA